MEDFPRLFHHLFWLQKNLDSVEERSNTSLYQECIFHRHLCLDAMINWSLGTAPSKSGRARRATIVARNVWGTGWGRVGEDGVFSESRERRA